MYKILGGLICLFALCMGDIAAYAESGACQAIRKKRNNLERQCTLLEAQRAGMCEPFKAEIISLDKKLKEQCNLNVNYEYGISDQKTGMPKVCDIEYNGFMTRFKETFTPDFNSRAEKRAYDRVLRLTGDEDEATRAAQFIALKEMLDDASNYTEFSGEDDTQFEDFKTSIDAALLSYDVYFDESIPGMLPDGVSRIKGAELEALGLTSSDLEDNTSGYYAAIYKDTRGGVEKYVYVNRGTENWADWKQNFKQGAPLAASQQYEIAMNNAGVLTRRLNEMNRKRIPRIPITISFSGHSLGGGLASAQALSTNQPANVINPAGLNRGTLAQGTDLSKANDLINAYIVEGEALDKANGTGDLLPWWADLLVGHDHRIVPQSYGNKKYVPGFQSGTFGGRSFKDSWSGWNHLVDLHGVHAALKGLVIDWCSSVFKEGAKNVK